MHQHINIVYAAENYDWCRSSHMLDQLMGKVVGCIGWSQWFLPANDAYKYQLTSFLFVLGEGYIKSQNIRSNTSQTFRGCFAHQLELSRVVLCLPHIFQNKMLNNSTLPTSTWFTTKLQIYQRTWDSPLPLKCFQYLRITKNNIITINKIYIHLFVYFIRNNEIYEW